MILGAQGVSATVENIDDGVELHLTTQNAERVERLREALSRIAEGVGQQPRRADRRVRPGGFTPSDEDRRPDRRGRGDAGGGPRDFPAPDEPDLMRMVLSGRVELDYREIDGGAALIFKAEDEETIAELQELMPTWLERVRERVRDMRGARGLMGGEGEVLRLLATGEIRVDVEELDRGVNVTVVSEDPELARKIKQELPAAIERLQESARLAGERRARAPDAEPGDRSGRPGRVRRGEGRRRGGF
jgi:hypothetical protein